MLNFTGLFLKTNVEHFPLDHFNDDNNESSYISISTEKIANVLTQFLMIKHEQIMLRPKYKSGFKCF